MTEENLTPEEIAMQMSENIDKSYGLMLETSGYIASRLEKLIAQIKNGGISERDVEDEKRKIALLKRNVQSLKTSIAESEEMLSVFKGKKAGQKEKLLENLHNSLIFIIFAV